MLTGMFDVSEISALVQVILIDVTLAGDNAIVIGLAAGGLPADQRRRAILAGTAVATVLRIAMALLAVRFLAIVGLTLAGGLLLLWVVWKMIREFLHKPAASGHDGAAPTKRKSLRQALTQIVIADLSMSLDNVLAVAGTAREHPWILVFGLGLSIALTAAASTLVSRLLQRWPAIVWVGIAIVAYVACRMIYDGTMEVSHHLA